MSIFFLPFSSRSAHHALTRRFASLLFILILAGGSFVPSVTFAQYGGSGFNVVAGPGFSAAGYCFKIGNLHFGGGYTSTGGYGLNVGSGSCANFSGGAVGIAALLLALINGVLVPLIFAFAFIVFLFGIFRYFIAGGDNPEEQKKGKQLVIYGLIGFFIMVSLWGLVNIVSNTFGLTGSSHPPLPYI